MSENGTIRVHQWAECSFKEADMNPHTGHKCGLVHESGGLRLAEIVPYGDPVTPLRYLGVIERPAPPKPKERVVYRFEEVAEPEADEEGWRWYAQHDGKISAYRRTPPPACAVRHHLRRTVERIPVEPERWEGRVKTIMLQPDGWAAVTTISRVGSSRPRIELGCSAFPTPAEAEADLPILRDLAEQYAAHYGATIEWKEAGA